MDRAPAPSGHRELRDLDGLRVDHRATHALRGVEADVRLVGERVADHAGADAVHDQVAVLEVAEGDGEGVRADRWHVFGLHRFPAEDRGRHFGRHHGREDGRGWLIGATYQRGRTDTGCAAADDLANLQRLRELLSGSAERLVPDFDATRVRSWAGVRCAAPDRLPLVGATALPGLWLCTAMGSRGLALAPLCGELLAARLHAEPLPVEAALARRLDATRFERVYHPRPSGERVG